MQIRPEAQLLHQGPKDKRGRLVSPPPVRPPKAPGASQVTAKIAERVHACLKPHPCIPQFWSGVFPHPPSDPLSQAGDRQEIRRGPPRRPDSAHRTRPPRPLGFGSQVLETPRREGGFCPAPSESRAAPAPVWTDLGRADVLLDLRPDPLAPISSAAHAWSKDVARLLRSVASVIVPARCVTSASHAHQPRVEIGFTPDLLLCLRRSLCIPALSLAPEFMAGRRLPKVMWRLRRQRGQSAPLARSPAQALVCEATAQARLLELAAFLDRCGTRLRLASAPIDVRRRIISPSFSLVANLAS